jgi:peroxin-19
MTSPNKFHQNLEQILDSALADFEQSSLSSHSSPTPILPENNNVNNSINSNVQNAPTMKPFEDPQAASNANSTEKPSTSIDGSIDDTDKLVEEFEKNLKAVFSPEFQKSLDELMGANETSPSLLPSQSQSQSHSKEQLPAQQQSHAETNTFNDPSNLKEPSAPPLSDDEVKNYFAKTLQMLSENLKKLEEEAKFRQADSKENDPLDDLLNEFENNKEFQGMMETMVKQLMSKEVLYEPMKEMLAKYPSWLEQNKGNLSNEDFNRYTKQYEYVARIVHAYETHGDNAFEEVVQLVNEMHEFGQPPDEIVRSLGLPVPPVQGTNPSLSQDPTKLKNDSKDGQDCSIM